MTRILGMIIALALAAAIVPQGAQPAEAAKKSGKTANLPSAQKQLHTQRSGSPHVGGEDVNFVNIEKVWVSKKRPPRRVR